MGMEMLRSFIASIAMVVIAIIEISYKQKIVILNSEEYRQPNL